MKKLLVLMLSFFTLALLTSCDPISGNPIENPEEPANPIVHTWYDTDTTYNLVYTFTEDKKVSISGNVELFEPIPFTVEGTYSFTDAAQMNVHIDVTSGTFGGNEVTAEQINEALSNFGFSSITDFLIDHYEDNKMYVTMEGLGDRILEYIPEYCGTWNVIDTSSFYTGGLWKTTDYITLNKDKTFKLVIGGNQVKLLGTYTMNEGKLVFNPLKGGSTEVADDELGDPESFKKYLETYDYHFGKNFGVLSYYDETQNHFIFFQNENAKDEVYTEPANKKDLVGRYVAISKGGAIWITYTYVFKADNTYTATTQYITTATGGLNYSYKVSGSYSVSDGALSIKPDASKTEFVSNSTLENPPVPAEPSSVDVTYSVQSGDSTLKITDLNKLFYKF